MVQLIFYGEGILGIFRVSCVAAPGVKECTRTGAFFSMYRYIPGVYGT